MPSNGISGNNLPHGGIILVNQLVQENVTRVFSVPGESFLNVLDGLHDSSIQNIVCRNEGGACFMAEAFGKITGQPGVAFVTRGPGSSNASGGIHTAKQDSTPMVLFIGQVKSIHRGKEAFQEIDYTKFFGSQCKWVHEIRSADEIPKVVAKAFAIANEGRPGPVAISLPEDILDQRSDVETQNSFQPRNSKPDRDHVRQLITYLEASTRPLIVAGGSVWSQGCNNLLEDLSTKTGIPVATTFRRQDRINNRHPNYAGDLTVGANPKLVEIVEETDLLLLLGTRFGDIPSQGYSIPSRHNGRRKIIHVFPSREEFGKNLPTDLGICSKPEDLLTELSDLQIELKAELSDWTEKCRSSYREWITVRDVPGKVKFPEIIAWLSTNLSEETIVTNGAGNYAAFLHRFYQPKKFGTQIGSTSGSMGYGLPAAISAKLEFPNRTVVCLAGDGCLQMTINEMSTISQYGIKLIVLVANNGLFGTIRMHQERYFPYRVSGTDLFNPDYRLLAKAYGWHGELVTETAQFPDAFERSLKADKPSLIELKLDPEAISPSETISSLRS
ncbi:MAG: thiamine pyrophosphate-binding protein [Rhodobacteraceae bacterium]|nr:thiamine pyrophosphate-binding protein [Paracoccaceae bacterium]MYE36770.1 thiamine pyrophosphate-binding protein [Paracoccaceae bacterium]MYG41767.1 thiamine pyrophosphate-binding protein [Paracoccaceae bacterium]